MQLLPQDPKKRKLLLIIGAAVPVLAAAIFFFMTYSASTPLSEVPQTASIAGGTVSEGSLKIIEGNVVVLREELQNSFYKSLRQYATVPDTATPGKQDPFASQQGEKREQ
ncbi:MAG: hypothetical protein NUV61_00895 [Candidatus Azambacteria bacterium]|nr:hypothetical protein [Candidatus Azambacteria bacterium]